jgi:hypothetical protein
VAILDAVPLLETPFVGRWSLDNKANGQRDEHEDHGTQSALHRGDRTRRHDSPRTIAALNLTCRVPSPTAVYLP